MLIWPILKLTLSIIFLAIGAHYFVTGAVNIAQNKQWSPKFIGIFLMGFMTTAPEVIVSISAIQQGYPDIALGNAIGSYISNLGLIIGLIALIKPIKILPSILKVDLPLLAIALSITISILATLKLTATSSILLIISLISFSIYILNTPHETQLTTTKKSIFYGTVTLVFGFITLIISSEQTVIAAKNIADLLGIYDLTIGLTIVAIGTSLPELITSITCIIHKQESMALGNIIGSNILVLLAVIAIPGILTPGYNINPIIITRDCSWMILITAAFWLCSNKRLVISRTNGIVLLSLFAIYISIVTYNLTSKDFIQNIKTKYQNYTISSRTTPTV